MVKLTIEQVNYIIRDIDRIISISNKLKQKIRGYKDPLDELIVSENEVKLIKENEQLITRVKELEQLNEHVRAVYKRDLKKKLKP